MRSFQISLAEVVALEKHGFAVRLGEGVGETVTEVQRCTMAALAEEEVRLAGDSHLTNGDRLQIDHEPLHERIEHLTVNRITVPVDEYRGLHVTCHRQTHDVRLFQNTGEYVGVGLFEEYG